MLSFEHPQSFLWLLLIPLYFILKKLGILSSISFPLVLSDWKGKTFEWKHFGLNIISILAGKELKNGEDEEEEEKERRKAEKKEKTLGESMMRIPNALPANIKAEKAQKKAAKIGFDFADYEEVLGKVYEELKELEEAKE